MRSHPNEGWQLQHETQLSSDSCANVESVASAQHTLSELVGKSHDRCLGNEIQFVPAAHHTGTAFSDTKVVDSCLCLLEMAEVLKLEFPSVYGHSRT